MGIHPNSLYELVRNPAQDPRLHSRRRHAHEGMGLDQDVLKSHLYVKTRVHVIVTKTTSQPWEVWTPSLRGRICTVGGTRKRYKSQIYMHTSTQTRSVPGSSEYPLAVKADVKERRGCSGHHLQKDLVRTLCQWWHTDAMRYTTSLASRKEAVCVRRSREKTAMGSEKTNKAKNNHTDIPFF